MSRPLKRYITSTLVIGTPVRLLYVERIEALPGFERWTPTRPGDHDKRILVAEAIFTGTNKRDIETAIRRVAGVRGVRVFAYDSEGVS